MKKVVLILLLIVCAQISKAQQTDSNNHADIDTVSNIVDVAPYFPGGIAVLYKFIEKNVNYPKEDRDNNIAGRVWVNFIVEKDGTLSDFKIIKSLSPTSDAEVIRVMKLCPKWEPGILAGKACRTIFTVPVKFG